MLFVDGTEHVCRLILLFSSVATLYTTFIPSNSTKNGDLIHISDWQVVQAPTNIAGPFDPDRPELSHCKTVRGLAGRWPLIGPQPRPFLELAQNDMTNANGTMDNMAVSVENDGGQPLSAVSRTVDRRDVGVKTTISTTTAVVIPQPPQEAFCVELKQATFDVGPSAQGGFLKTRDPADINIDQNRRYWLIWDIQGPHELVVYSRPTGEGQLWHRDLVSSSPMSHTGHTSYMGHPRQLRFDLSLSPQGAKGTVTLFAVNTFKSTG